MQIVAGIFLILHGLVHLLYAGQAFRYFELRPGMIWPDASWLFSKLIKKEAVRWLAAISLALAALGFVAGGVGLFAQAEAWHPVAVYASIFSTVVFALFWDGKFNALADQGGIGLLIDVIVLAAALSLKWP